jgi:long-chain acyl-CoA synthetase
MTTTVTQGLRRAATIRPGGIATRDGSMVRTWGETRARVARLAAALSGRGLAPGDRVAVLSLNSARYFEALFAIPWAAGIAVPVNTRLAPPEIAYVLQDSGSRFLLIDETFAPLLPKIDAGRLHAIVLMGDAAPAEMLGYEALIAESPLAEDRAGDASALAGIYYTGGTTGQAKGVMLSHGNLVANAMNVIVNIGYDRDTNYLHAPPMFHLADGCSTFGVTIQAGSHTFLPRYDPAAFLEIVEREAVTDVTLVPTMINLFLNHPRFGECSLASLKRIFFGASPMPDGVLRKALRSLPQVKFQQAWGMTELSPIATTMDWRFSVLDGPNTGKLRSCGQPVPSAEIRIVNAEGCEVPRGTIGEIVVRGPTVMQGYWNKPEATAAVLREGWLHSGDGGYMDEEGFVFVVDRMKDMIVTGGENVYSAEVESVISLMPEVAEAAVIGIPDEQWGEAVHAVVVPRAGMKVDAEAVKAFCRERIAGFKCPRSVELRAEPLPLSATGKVLKTELRAPYWRGRDRAVN